MFGRAWRPGLAACLCLAAAGASLAGNATIIEARYGDPTSRYDHGILGDAVEWGSLRLTLSDGRDLSITLPDTRVFEDIMPRLADLDGDGAPEVIAVETDLARGARLSIYGPDGLLASTPFIGRSHRWLAPAGVADLDGDGHTEIAYVDRPHLAKILRIWRYRNGQLTHVADKAGFSNHKIGWDFIAGGLRFCGGVPEIILASADWQQVIVATLDQGRIDATAIAPYTGPGDLADALTCP